MSAKRQRRIHRPTTLRASAPRAIRMPISDVRCATEWESTLWIPTAASSSAILRLPAA